MMVKYALPIQSPKGENSFTLTVVLMVHTNL